MPTQMVKRIIKMNYQAVSVLPIKLGKSKKNKKIKKNKKKKKSKMTKTKKIRNHLNNNKHIQTLAVKAGEVDRK